MEQKGSKRKDPLYDEDIDARSNLELLHDEHVARAITYSQTALTIFVLGATIAYFLYIILEPVELEIFGLEIAGIRVFISIFIFVIFTFLGGKRSYFSWHHLIKARFIQTKLGSFQTWEKHKFDDDFKNFRKYDDRAGKLDESIKRRYYLHLDKIYDRTDKMTKSVFYILNKIKKLFKRSSTSGR